MQESEAAFSLQAGAIRFGLLPIAHVGAKTIDHLYELQQKQPFENLFDFCVRTDPRICSKRATENLIKAGALDFFGHDRAVLLRTLDHALGFAEKVRAFQEESAGMFTIKPEVPDHEQAEPLTALERLDYEQEVLGFYLSGHPIEPYSQQLKSYSRLPLELALEQRRRVRIAGLLVSTKQIKTKKR